MPDVYCIGMGIETAVSRDCDGLLKAIHGKTTNYKKLLGFNSGKYNCQVAAEITTYPFDKKYNIIAENAMYQAIKDAGLRREHLKGNRHFGFIFGTSMGNMPAIESYLKNVSTRKQKKYGLAEGAMHQLAPHLCRKIGIKGPCITISNTCVSSINVIGAAASLIASGQMDACIAGCADVISESIYAGMDGLKVLSMQQTLKPFSKDSDGMLLGDGAGFVVLCRKDFPLVKKVYGRIDGYSVTSDGVHLTAPDKEARGMVLALERSLQMAGITPPDIDLIIAGGTGSNYNDTMQIEALKKVWGGCNCQIPVTEIKPLVGHTLSAAVMIEMIAVFKMLEAGRITPISTKYTSALNPQEVLWPEEIPAGKINRFILMSAGFSGVNGALVITKGLN